MLRSTLSAIYYGQAYKASQASVEGDLNIYTVPSIGPYLRKVAMASVEILNKVPLLFRKYIPDIFTIPLNQGLAGDRQSFQHETHTVKG